MLLTPLSSLQTHDQCRVIEILDDAVLAKYRPHIYGSKEVWWVEQNPENACFTLMQHSKNVSIDYAEAVTVLVQKL